MRVARFSHMTRAPFAVNPRKSAKLSAFQEKTLSITQQNLGRTECLETQRRRTSFGFRIEFTKSHGSCATARFHTLKFARGNDDSNTRALLRFLDSRCHRVQLRTRFLLTFSRIPSIYPWHLYRRACKTPSGQGDGNETVRQMLRKVGRQSDASDAFPDCKVITLSVAGRGFRGAESAKIPRHRESLLLPTYACPGHNGNATGNTAGETRERVYRDRDAFSRSSARNPPP